MSVVYTEAEAAERWCPFARVASFPLSPGDRVVVANRSSTGEATGSCIGSRCMAWRWKPGRKFLVPYNNEGTNRPEQVSENATFHPGVHVADQPFWQEPRVRGYCGLAGQ